MSRLLVLLACLGLLGVVHAQDNIKPRMADSLITDKGYGDRSRGWYDVQCQGAANDYCRYVGDAPNIWWSCALAGSNNQHTPKGVYTEQTSSPVACSKGPSSSSTKPRPPRNFALRDMGYTDRRRGWFDALCRGAADDYCRYVGPTPNYPFKWFSCALAGASTEHTAPGRFNETNMGCAPGVKPPSPAPAPRTPIKPRMADSAITDKGYPDRARGWYDAQGQGAANDYCRYVGDAPNIWWSCALAGSNNQHTPKGTYNESSTSKVPCSNGASAAYNGAGYSKLPRNFWLSDFGYTDRTYGWYDVLCRGSADDYCRYVGPTADHPSVWWSCALAGADSEHTAPGRFSEDTSCRVACSNPVPVPAGQPLPPKNTHLTDMGQDNKLAGWFDVTCSGQALDYCRVVGGRGNGLTVWYSCALAGADTEHTAPGVVDAWSVSPVPCSRPAPFTGTVKPRQTNIQDMGYPEDTTRYGRDGGSAGVHGWYDAQCQGVANDYCRFVGPADGPTNMAFPWFSCALAGANSEHTAVGLFTPQNVGKNCPKGTATSRKVFL